MKFGQWIGLISLAISLYILWEIRQVLLLVFTAILLATALNKLARKLQKKGIPRTGAVVLALTIFSSVMIGFFLLIVPPFIVQFQELTTTKFPQILALWTNSRNQLQTLLPPQVIQYLPDLATLNQQIQPLINGILGRSLAFVSNSLGFIINLLLVLILTIMLLVQPMAYRQALVRLFPSFYRRRANSILDQCEASLGKWFIGALISMSVVATLSFICLSILHIPLALAQGVLAGLLNFIPNIGPTLSVVLPMAIALLDAPWKSAAILVLYIVIQQFETNLLTPYVMSQQVSLLPAATLLAQLFFANFFGFLGFVLAIPLTVVGQVWIKEALVKDILDQWHHHESTEPELVLVADSASGAISSSTEEPVAVETGSQQPSQDES